MYFIIATYQYVIFVGNRVYLENNSCSYCGGSLSLNSFVVAGVGKHVEIQQQQQQQHQQHCCGNFHLSKLTTQLYPSLM